MEEFTDEDMKAMLSAMEDEGKKGTFVSPYWKPTNDGTYPLRFITPLKQFNEKLFYLKVRMHYLGNRGYACLNQTLEDKNGNLHEATSCPICEKVRQLYRLNDKDSEEVKVASSISAKDRYIARVIVRGKKDKEGNDTEAKPEFYEFGKKIHDYFFNTIKNQPDIGNFLSLKDGRDFLLVKKGTGRNTTYDGSQLSMKQTPIFSEPEKLKGLLAELPKMKYSQLVSFSSPEEMKAALEERLNASSPVEDFISGGAPDPLNPMTQSVSVNPTVKNEEQTSIDDLLSMI